MLFSYNGIYFLWLIFFNRTLGQYQGRTLILSNIFKRLEFLFDSNTDILLASQGVSFTEVQEYSFSVFQ